MSVESVNERRSGDVFTADFDKNIVYRFDPSIKFKNKIISLLVLKDIN
jgi:hypothetical protein